jgi:bacillithiol biosynthesis cysteine-adding enzyme BshC
VNVTRISYRDTGFFSKTVLDYLAGNKAIRPFYAYEPNAESVPDIIKELTNNFSVDRSVLVNTLNDQYKAHAPHEEVSANIEALKEEKTFTITTAHQLNIFTGPLYYIYKILNTVRVARDLEQQYPGYCFVPCYWMGSEDHDFEEVNHIHLFGKRIEWDNFQGGSMGSYSTEGIADLIPSIREILRRGEHLDNILGIMASAYTRKQLADAVREMLNALFGRYGLVVIDGNCRSMKSMFRKAVREELVSRPSKALVDEQAAELTRLGYKPQAAPRAINLFYSDNRSRQRIVADGEGFILADESRSFKANEMLQIAEDHPERFSPNVILRPLHQQMILPNVAYIGGGSEVAYWMQLKPVFDHFGVHFPMLLLRTSAQIIPVHIQKGLDKLGMSPRDLFRPAEELKQAYVRASHDDLDLHDEKSELKKLFESIQSKTRAVDASMESWIGSEERKAEKIVEHISRRLMKAGKAKNESALQKIDKLKARLFPEGQLQERYENFMSWYSDKGPEWFDDLLEILDPFEREFYIVQ